MKRLGVLIISFLLGSVSLVTAQSQLSYNQSGLRELVKITIKYSSQISSSKKDDYANLWVRNDNSGSISEKMCINDNNLCFAVWDSALNKRCGVSHIRWEGGYLLDAQLSTYFPEVGTCVISAELQTAKGFFPAVRLVYLYDNENGEMKPINLLKESYSFNITEDQLKLIDNDRFYVKVYAAEILKSGDELIWSDPSSWESGEVPESEEMHVLIREGSSVGVSSSDNYTIGYLTNYGQVHNNGTLTIREGVEIIP